MQSVAVRQSTPGGPCAECGAAFDYDADFYAARSLAVPTRCRECRERRLGRRVQVRGYVAGVGARFAFVEAEGRTYFAQPLSLPRGSAVTFYVDPEEAPPPGRKPHAFDVTAEEAPA